jgi:hypothetical protein
MAGDWDMTRLRRWLQRWLEIDVAAGRLLALEETRLATASFDPMLRERLTPLRNDLTALAAAVAKRTTETPTEHAAFADPHLGRW